MSNGARRTCNRLTGVADPTSQRMVAQEFSDPHRIRRDPFTPQTQRLNPDEDLMRRKGIHHGANLHHDFNAQSQRKRYIPKRTGIRERHGPLARLCQVRELVGLAPVEASRVDNDSTYRGAMAPEPFGGRVNHDVCAMFNGGAPETAGAESVVYLVTDEYGFVYRVNWGLLQRAVCSHVQCPQLP